MAVKSRTDQQGFGNLWRRRSIKSILSKPDFTLFLLSKSRRNFNLSEFDKMDWDLLSDNEQIFASNDSFTTSNFDTLPPLFQNNWNQFDFSASSPNNLLPTPLEDSSFNSPKMKKTKKEPSQQVNGSDFETQDPLQDWFEGLTDCQLVNLDQVDDIFLNSFSVDDFKIISETEPSQTLSNPLDGALSFESNIANLQNDPSNYFVNQNSTATSCGLDASVNPLLSEDLSVNSFLTSQSPMPCEVSVMHDKPMGVADVANPKFSDATVLQNLESVLLKINGDTRICFRDSFYRMANNSKKRKFTDEKRHTLLPSDSRSEQLEDDTNVIDRAVTHLMFDPSSRGPSDAWVPQISCTSTRQHVQYV